MENKDKHRCFRGFTVDQCPKHSLEITKIVYAILLVIAVTILVSCNLMWHG